MWSIGKTRSCTRLLYLDVMQMYTVSFWQDLNRGTSCVLVNFATLQEVKQAIIEELQSGKDGSVTCILGDEVEVQKMVDALNTGASYDAEVDGFEYSMHCAKSDDQL